MFKRLRALVRGKPPVQDPREIFAREVSGYLRSLPHVISVERGPDVFALDVVTTSGAVRVNLDNAFAETRESSPEHRRERLEVLFQALTAEEEEEGWDAARDIVVPVLRGASYGIDSTTELDAAFVRRPFLPYLDVFVAMDRESSIEFVSRHACERWGVEEREIIEAAEARISVLTDPSVELYDQTHGPLWLVSSNDGYESSRLLVPGWLASFRGKVEGEPIAIVPDRSTLMVGGDGREEMIERLVDKADREFDASSRRLSPALYTVDHAGTVVPYAPSTSDAKLARKVTLGHEKLAMFEHAEQKRALDEHYEQNGIDVFVASYLLFENASGVSVRSVSVWTKGVRSYLPRTENVMLVLPGDDVEQKPPTKSREVPFELVEKLLVRVPGLHPARFETPAEFPSIEQND